jgi:DNA-binding NarL/FixJ family response regulator
LEKIMDITTVGRGEKEGLRQGLALKLFIAGGRPESARAVARLRQILKDYDLNASSVQIVDIELAPEVAKEAQVIGTPALVREYPPPRKSVIGDLSDAYVVLEALDLPITKKPYTASLTENPQGPLILKDAAHSEVKTVRVLLIGFNPVVREGLQTILAMDHRIELIPDVANAEQALRQLKRASDQGRPINVALTELQNGTFDGIQVTRIIKTNYPEVAVLLLTESLNYSDVIDVIPAGAAEYIFLKDMSPQMLLQSIHRIVEGGMQMQTQLRPATDNLTKNGQKIPAQRTAEAAHLTKREVEVLRLLGNGDSNKTIADSLGITLDTAKKHTRNVINKLQARSRTHAAVIAAQAGILGKPFTTAIAQG